MGLRVVKFETGTLIPLAGAVFDVFDPDGVKLASLPTDVNGEIKLPLTRVGYYTVTERIPSAYHILPTHTSQGVQVAYNEVATVTFTNDPYGSLRVEKRDAANGDNLAGAVIQIKHIATGVTHTATTDSSGSVTFDNLPVGGYEIRELTAPQGYALDATVHTAAVRPLTEGAATYTLTNKANPGLRIIKLDRATATPIEGVVFEIFHDGELYGEYTTNLAGEILLTNLPAGTYTAREKSTVLPYQLDATAQWIEITAGQGHIAQLIFLNDAKPGVYLIKLDSENLSLPVPNAKFRIKQISGGSYDQEHQSDQNGEINLTFLDPGVYQIYEVSVPEPYLIDDVVRTVEILAGKPDARFVFTNTKKPNLLIVKTDALTGAPIPNTTFTVKKVDSSTITTVKTDANGEALLTALDPGVYEITEKSVPDTHLLNTTPQLITLFPNRTGVVRFQNYPKPTLTIFKRDSITKDAIAGTKFNIFYASNNTFTGEINDLGTFYTDAEGKIVLTGLRDGWLRITETEASPGYTIKEPATQELYIKAGENKTIIFENVPKSALIIKKIDSETGVPVAGATFEVKYLAGTSGSGGTTIFTGVTSINGTIVLTNLNPGTYVVQETKAAPGYELSNPSVQTAYLSGEDQDVVTLTFENAHKGGLIIKKLDSVTKQPVKGATFKVTDSSGAVIGANNGEYTTDAEDNELCRAFIEDNIAEIAYITERELTTHRFFIVFQYEPRMKARNNTVRAVAERMNEEADTARRYLELCGLEVLEPEYLDNAALEMLYQIINKKTSRRAPLPEGVFDMIGTVHGVYGAD